MAFRFDFTLDCRYLIRLGFARLNINWKKQKTPKPVGLGVLESLLLAATENELDVDVGAQCHVCALGTNVFKNELDVWVEEDVASD
jgi:hypothetical protein